MSSPLCTIVVVPRERFSKAPQSFQSLCRHTSSSYPVIYIDSCSQKSWARQLDALAAEGRIKLIRTGFLISQHEAYNLAIPHLRTKYVIFVDNDAFFTPGWAENLLSCAEETGGDVVMPVLEDKDVDRDWRIHMCGGDCGVEEREGRLLYRHVHPLHGQVQTQIDLTRCRTGLMEYHAFLVRCETLQKVGPFDEGYWPAMDHVDFSLMMRAAGGTIWVEPSALVRYELPSRLKWEDWSFFLTRWSDELVATNVQHFENKWGVTLHASQAAWYKHFRRRHIQTIRKPFLPLLGNSLTSLLFRPVWFLEALASRLAVWWNRVPDRRRQLEKLGALRTPALDRAAVQAFAATIFRVPKELSRELNTVA